MQTVKHQHGVYLEYMYHPYCLHFNRHAIIQVFEGLSPNRTATLIFWKLFFPPFMLYSLHKWCKWKSFIKSFTVMHSTWIQARDVCMNMWQHFRPCRFWAKIRSAKNWGGREKQIQWHFFFFFSSSSSWKSEYSLLRKVYITCQKWTTFVASVKTFSIYGVHRTHSVHNLYLHTPTHTGSQDIWGWKGSLEML